MDNDQTAPVGDGAIACAPIPEPATVAHGGELHPVPVALRPAFLLHDDNAREDRARVCACGDLASRQTAFDVRLAAAAIAAHLLPCVVQDVGGQGSAQKVAL